MDASKQPAAAAAEAIANLLRACIIESVDDPVVVPEAVSSDLFHNLVERNRLGATLFAAAGENDAWPVDPSQEAEWKREAYRRAVVQGQQLNQAVQLADLLAARDIPCMCMRGPFAASRLYGDVSWRPFSDIDLLVPREHAREAWSVSETAGFQLFQDNMPLGYFLRHHLHWQMKHPVSGLICDLHWAVEHPYRLYTIDYEAIFERARTVEVDGLRWLEPDPADHFLILAMHLKKHMPRLFALSSEDDAALQVFLQGEVFHIIDLALILRRDAAELDHRQMLETAEAWGCVDVLAGGLACVQQLFDVDLPEQVLEQARARVPEWQAQAAVSGWANGVPAWWARAAFKGGFRTEKMVDAWAYMNPPPSYFGESPGIKRSSRRLRHRCQASMRLAFAGVDTLASVSLAQLRGRRRAVNQTNIPMGSL